MGGQSASTVAVDSAHNVRIPPFPPLSIFQTRTRFRRFEKSQYLRVLTPSALRLQELFQYSNGIFCPVLSFYLQLSRISAISAIALSGSTTVYISDPPPHNKVAARARWLVYHSLWSSVGTVSVRLAGKPWGNVLTASSHITYLDHPTLTPGSNDPQYSVR